MAKLYFYYSAMNAGKTTTLLQSSYNYHERGMRTLLLTPRIDNRYDTGQITSRIGLSADAVIFGHDNDLYELIDETHRRTEIHCVMVDEAQFLTRQQVFQLGLVCDQIHIPVLTFGIRTDFPGDPFEGSKFLL
ncbi:MAG: thymidine kinase, partial [Pseudomonadales bacterium]